jgi:hypothetical protein
MDGVGLQPVCNVGKVVHGRGVSVVLGMDALPGWHGVRCAAV